MTTGALCTKAGKIALGIAAGLVLSLSSVAFAQTNGLPNDNPAVGVPTTLQPTDSSGSGFTFTPVTGTGASPSAAASGSKYCSGVGGSLRDAPNGLSDVIKFITCFLLNSLVPLIFALALVVFLFGVVKFMGSGESEEKTEGRKFMLWGVIALAVMLSVWGLTNILGDTFGVRNAIPQLPQNAGK